MHNKDIENQFDQASAQNTTEKVLGHDRANDRSQDFYEQLRQGRLSTIDQLQQISVDRARHDLKAAEQRDFAMGLAQLKALTHSAKAFEELIEKSAEEAKAVSEIFSGVQLESIKTLLVDALAEALKKNEK